MTPLILSLLLGAPMALVQQDAETPEARIEAAIEAYDADYQAWVTKLRAAKPEEREALYEENPTQAAGELLAELVQEVEPTSEAAFKAHGFVVKNLSGSDAMLTALDALSANFADRDDLASVVSRVSITRAESDKPEAFLRHLLENSKSLTVRGTACYQLASGMKYTLDRMAPEPEKAAALEKEAIALYERGLGEFAEVELSRGLFGDRAEKDIFELRNLTTGKVAPDIEGEDIGGTAFKLSDYRGKVVLLDFWGDW